MNRFPGVLAISMAICLLAPATALAQAGADPAPFCAKNWDDLTTVEKDKIVELSEFTASFPGLKKNPIQIWDTRMIPYVFDPKVPDEMRSRIKSATKALSDKTLIRFVECDRAVLKKTSVKAFVYITDLNDACPLMKDKGPGCSTLGIKKKEVVGGLPAVFQTTDEGKIKKNASKIGLRLNDEVIDKKKMLRADVGTVIHEFIHRLGFAHQHQSPFTTLYFSKIDQGDQCGRRHPAYEYTYWIPYYDPASIMHYPIASCGGMELDCIATPVERGAQTHMLKCKVDNPIDEYVCGPSTKKKGKDCFVRPPYMTLNKDTDPPTVKYHGNQFGQRQCVSMMDQAWLLSQYFPVEKDTYGLEASGLCKAN
jgi:hypothetical protein